MRAKVVRPRALIPGFVSFASELSAGCSQVSRAERETCCEVGTDPKRLRPCDRSTSGRPCAGESRGFCRLPSSNVPVASAEHIARASPSAPKAPSSAYRVVNVPQIHRFQSGVATLTREHSVPNGGHRSRECPTPAQRRPKRVSVRRRRQGDLEHERLPEKSLAQMCSREGEAPESRGPANPQKMRSWQEPDLPSCTCSDSV